MSDVSLGLFASAGLVCAGFVGVVVTLIFVLRGQVPEEVRAKYPKRVIDRSQLPFTEKWREAVDPKDIPVFVKARIRKQVLMIAVAVFLYLVLISRLMYLHVVIRALANRAH